MAAASVLSEYQTRLAQLRRSMDHARATQNLGLRVVVATLALFALLVVGVIRWHLPVWCIALPVAVVAGTVWRYVTVRSRRLRLHRLHDFYERGIARVQDRWHGNGFAGEEFRIASHVYDSDLHILGSGSLFELLCTARTGIGRRRLAEYLLRPCVMAETRAGQESVRELKPFAEMRERIALLGKYDFQESTWETFSEWISIPAVTSPAWVRLVAFGSSIALGAVLLAGFTTSISIGALFPWSVALLAINMGIAWCFRKRTTRLNNAARRVGVEIGVAREGIQFVSTLTFQSAKLRSIQRSFTEGNAAAVLRQLEKLTNAISECDKPFFDLPAQGLILRTQLCFAIEGWKVRHAGHLEEWLNAWAEFEALACLGGYAAEHPNDPFPEFHEGRAAFAAHGLGHPLIPIKVACGTMLPSTLKAGST